MARYWCATKSRMAALCHAPVRYNPRERCACNGTLDSFSNTNISFFLLLDSPEPHILLFRRVLGTNPQSGRVDPELVAVAREEFKDQMGLRQNAVA
jgi:hypothetical protein